MSVIELSWTAKKAIFDIEGAISKTDAKNMGTEGVKNRPLFFSHLEVELLFHPSKVFLLWMLSLDLSHLFLR